MGLLKPFYGNLWRQPQHWCQNHSYGTPTLVATLTHTHSHKDARKALAVVIALLAHHFKTFGIFAFRCFYVCHSARIVGLAQFAILPVRIFITLQVSEFVNSPHFIVAFVAVLAVVGCVVMHIYIHKMRNSYFVIQFLLHNWLESVLISICNGTMLQVCACEIGERFQRRCFK